MGQICDETGLDAGCRRLPSSLFLRTGSSRGLTSLHRPMVDTGGHVTLVVGLQRSNEWGPLRGEVGFQQMRYSQGQ